MSLVLSFACVLVVYPNALTKQQMSRLNVLTTGLPIADSSQVPAGPGSSTRPGRLLWGSSLSSVADDEEHTRRSA